MQDSFRKNKLFRRKPKGKKTPGHKRIKKLKPQNNPHQPFSSYSPYAPIPFSDLGLIFFELKKISPIIFEVNAIVYDFEIANQLSDIFFEDLKYADKINLTDWSNRPWYSFLLEQTARLMSPML